MDAVQTVWTLCNLGALIGVLVVSVRAVSPDLSRTASWRLALALSLPALLLNPVLVTIGFGQVNLVVTFLVMWDLLSGRRVGPSKAPLGLATGIAAAIKLTPILFVPYLVLTRRSRGALVCVATFVTCELVAFLASPTSSMMFWTKDLFKPDRAGSLSFVGNQNLTAVIERFNHGVLPDVRLAPVLIVAAGAGLWLAALAHRRSSPMLGVLICAATGLLVSPISWVHHMVWVVPAILWLALAPDRPRWGVPLAAGTAVLFWSAPIWWVPYKHTSDLHLNAWQLVAGNSSLPRHAALRPRGNVPGRSAEVHRGRERGATLTRRGLTGPDSADRSQRSAGRIGIWLPEARVFRSWRDRRLRNAEDSRPVSSRWTTFAGPSTRWPATTRR